MSLFSSVVSFAVVAGLVTIIPGLDTAMVLRSAITQPRKQAFATALGVSTGLLIWGAFAAVGVSALLTASTVAYTGLRLLGAIYMIGLGSRLLIKARAQKDDRGRDAASELSDGLSRGWSTGLMTNLLNPKIGAFYVAVLPQFIPAHDSHLAVGLLLAGVHNAEGIAWFTAIILGANAARRVLDRRSTHRAIDGITGIALVGFGLKLALSPR